MVGSSWDQVNRELYLLRGRGPYGCGDRRQHL